jgi:hypothetical protein
MKAVRANGAVISTEAKQVRLIEPHKAERWQRVKLNEQEVI